MTQEPLPTAVVTPASETPDEPDPLLLAIPEAPVVFWGNLYSIHTGERYNLTIRHYDPDKAVLLYREGVDSARRHLGLSPDPNAWRKEKGKADEQARATEEKAAEKGLPSPAQAQQPVQPPAQTSPQPPPASPAPPAPSTQPGAVNEYVLHKITVEPLKDDKAKVGFIPVLANGKPGQFAECYEQRLTAQEWADKFAPFSKLTPDDFRSYKQDHVLQGIRFSVRVSERQNSKGQPFKDLVDLKAA